MTRYSIPSETTPENLDYSLNEHEHYPSEVDFSDWESRMARLVGFEEEFPTTDPELGEEPTDLQPLPALVEESEPVEANSTENSLSSNPFAKLTLVGAGTFVVVLGVGAFLSQLMGGGNQKPKATNNVAPQTTPQPTVESRLQDLQGQVETLKTKLALAEQADAIKAAQQKLRTGKVTTPTQVAARPTPQVERRRPTPVQTVYVPQQTAVQRPTQPPETPQQPVTAQVTPTPVPSVAPPEVQPTVQMSPPAPPDPMEEWARIAKLGSYGQVLVAAKPPAATPEVAQQPANPPNPRTQPQANNPEPEPTPSPSNSVIGQAQSQGQQAVPVGTNVKAVLATAVFGETTRSSGNNRNEGAKNLFVVRLKEPLKSADGKVVLPAKTELLTEINSLSEQGLLQLNVVKVVMQNEGNISERSLPDNALLVRGSQGRPLIANQFSGKGSSMLGMDMSQFVLGGIGKAAELFNRTESQVTTTSTGTIVTNSNPRRNVWAGVLEGGIRTVVPQISQRNQQAMSQAMQRSNVWFLPAGTEVEIYVNQMMQF